MASTTKNPFTPDLGQTGTPTYIQNPVKEPNALSSVASLVQDLAPGAVAAYQNYKTAEDVIKPIDEAISTYEAFYQNRPDLANAGIQDTQDQIWNNLGEVPTDTTGMNLGNEGAKLDTLDKAFTQNLELLTKAKEQGVMSESGVLAKINQIVRQAVAKNPWLEDKYYEQTQRYLKRSGIADVITMRQESAKDAIKRQQDLYDKAAQEMKERNIPWVPNMPYEMMINSLNQARTKEFNLKMARDFKEGRLLANDNQITSLLESGDMEKGHQLDIEKFQQDAIVAYSKAKSPQEIASINTQLELQYRNSMMAWRRSLGGAVTDPNAQKFLDSVDKDYTTILSALKTAASGKEATEILQNNLKNVQSIQEMALRSKLNPDEVNLGLKILNTIPEDIRLQSMTGNAASPLNDLQRQGISLLNNNNKLVNGAMGIVAPDNMGTKTLQNSAVDGSFNTVFNHLSSASTNRVIQAEAKQQLGRAMITFNRVVSSGMPDKDAYTFANSIITTAAKNADNIRANAATPLYAAESTKLIDFSMGKTVTDLTNIVGQLSSENNINVKFDVLSNGVFVVNTGDPELDRRFADKFTKQINNALDAFSSARGQLSKEAAPEFYSRYFSHLLNKKDQEVNTKAVTGTTTTAPTGTVVNQSMSDAEFNKAWDNVSNTPSTISAQEREAKRLEIQKRYAAEFDSNKLKLKDGKMTKQEFNDEASRINSLMKQELTDLGF